jgi:hypothetical protein
MELEIFMLTEISQAPKAKYCIFSLSCESNPKLMIMVTVIGHECERGTV